MAALVESGPSISLEVLCEGLTSKCVIPFTKNLKNSDIEMFVRDKYNLNKHLITVKRDYYYNLWDVIQFNLDLLNEGFLGNEEKSTFKGQKNTSKIPNKLLQSILRTQIVIKDNTAFVSANSLRKDFPTPGRAYNKYDDVIEVFENLTVFADAYIPMEGDSSSSSNNPMKIYVKGLTGRHKRIYVKPSDYIANIKKICSKLCSVASDRIRLICNGQQLSDVYTISHYKIQTDATIHVVLQMRGGMYHWSSGRFDNLKAGENFVQEIKLFHDNNTSEKKCIELNINKELSYNELFEIFNSGTAVEEGDKKLNT